MAKKILVLAGKRVGFETLSYLFSIGAPIEHVIIGSRDDVELITLVSEKECSYDFMSSKLQEEYIAENTSYEWILSLWNPAILKSKFLDLGKNKLNLHPSLVPNCRGNDTAAWTIRKGLAAGVSLLDMNEGIDTGGVYTQKEVTYSLVESGKSLFEKLQLELISLFIDSWVDIYNGKIVPKPQKGSVTYHDRKQTNDDRIKKISKVMSLGEFITWVSGHDFSPAFTAEVIDNDKTYKITIDIEEKIKY